MKRILGMTSIRSDYELMTGVYDLLDADTEVDFRLLVSGTHLSRKYGYSIENIRTDGFKILDTIESLPDEDSPVSRLVSAGVILQFASKIVADWKPELIVFAGDREDTLIYSMVGQFLGIPTLHFFGGDFENDGHPDTLTRSATSKMSTAHIVSTFEHRSRLIAIGESEDRIFVAGSVALDKFVEGNLANELASDEVLPHGKDLVGYALVIFHPVNSEIDDIGNQLRNIIEVLDSEKIPICIGHPNSDPGNFQLIEIIEQIGMKKNCWAFKNLSQNEFLHVYRNAKFIIGNSSSGIIEAASIPLGAINVGRRQSERMSGKNVIFCSGTKESILGAVREVLSSKFQLDLINLMNPYGDGRSSIRAYEFIKATDFDALLRRIDDPLKIEG